jgi:putative transposase
LAVYAPELGELAAQDVGGAAFQPAGDLCDLYRWRVVDEEVDVIGLGGELDQLASERGEHPAGTVLQAQENRCRERCAAVLHAEHQVQVQQVNAVSARPRGNTGHQPMMAARRYRLRLTNVQEERIGEWSGALRALWNAALEQRRRAWRDCGVSVGLAEQCRNLTDARAAIPWLADVPAQTAQQTLRDLDRAYSNFFAGRAAFPRWRSRRSPAGLRFPQGAQVRRLNRRWAEVRLPKLGWVRFRWTRPPGGTVKHATLTRDALGWHVSLCVELDKQPAPPNRGPAVGVDRGVVALIATSDGDLIDPEFWTAGERKRRKALDQHLARQRKGSNRRRHTVNQLAGLRARVARRRQHHLHEVSHQLATRHGLVAVEALNVKNMTRSARGTLDAPGINVRQKAGLNREILEQGWGELHRQLAYKTVWYGSELIEVPAAYSSQTCSACGTIDNEARESQARFACRACEHIQNADINAARVILQRALAQQHSARGRRVTARGDLGIARSVKRERSQQKAAA